LETELDLSVICYQCAGSPDLHPNPDQIFETGGRLLVLASLDTLQQLNQWAGEKA